VPAINLEDNYDNQQDRAPYVDSISKGLKECISVLMDIQTVVSVDAYDAYDVPFSPKILVLVERLTCATGVKTKTPMRGNPRSAEKSSQRPESPSTTTPLASRRKKIMLMMKLLLVTLLLVFIQALHGAPVVVVTIQPRNGSDQVSPLDACWDIQDELTALLVDHQAVIIQVQQQTTGRSLADYRSKYYRK
jgi:hypothetical protein